MKLENQNILILSNEPWGDTWFSKHNYAFQLSKKNKVIFIDPPQPFKLFNFFRKNITEKPVNENLTVLTYKNVAPVRIELLRRINEFFVFSKLNKHLKGRRFSDPIFWTFDPIRLSSPEKLSPKKFIFHAVDKFRFITAAETIISRKADLILCVAEEIAANYRPLNKNVHVIPHAIPSDEFVEPKKSRGEKITGVFVGNLDQRIDFTYTQYIIKAFPEVEFHFVGNIAKNCEANMIFSSGLPNVVYHGEKPFNELKDYIHKADFCILFKDNNVNGNNISSHKMLQYFAHGKPIFASYLTQYSDVSHLLYMHNDKEVMVKLFADFLKKPEDAELVKQRIAYAQKHSFENTFVQIEKLL
jgi:hypothetical protein